MGFHVADTLETSVIRSQDHSSVVPPERIDRKIKTTHADTQVYESIPIDNDPTKPIVVFLHGNSFCSKIWLPFFDNDIASTYHLIAIDYPGHGESSDASDAVLSYNMPGYADAILQVLEEIQPSRYVALILLGHPLCICTSKSSRSGRSHILLWPVQANSQPTYVLVGYRQRKDLILEVHS